MVALGYSQIPGVDFTDNFAPVMNDVIRLENAGENTAFEEGCKNEGFGITFEYSAPGTLQHNGVVERAFATLYGGVRAMMNHA